MEKNRYSVKQVISLDKSVARINEIIESDPEFTRNDIAGFVCDEFQLTDALGNPQRASCLKALRELDEKGVIKLPEPSMGRRGVWKPRRPDHPVPLPEGVPESVEQIENLHLVVVDSDNHELMAIHNELLCSEHPLGDRRIVGRQLRYLIRSEHGWLGAISFSSSALRIEARDRWIGWEGGLLVQNRNYVVNMSRFLIRNSIKCRNLASRILAECVKRMPVDYENRFGYRPLLIETFVDTENHNGTCYKAAGWELIGRTKGRGRNDTHNEAGQSIKDIHLYPLDVNFREKMGLPEKEPPGIEAVAPAQGIQGGDWADREFGDARLGDKRLTRRLVKIAGNKSRNPGASYLKAAHGNRYDIKGYYNFVRSGREENNFDAILSTHIGRTRQRMKSCDTVLVIQDTSDLNYSNLNHCEGLGLIGSNQTGAESEGLKLHSSFTVDTRGLPLGILTSECYAPDPAEVKKKKSEKRNTPITEKESGRWLEGYQACLDASKLMPDTRIINVMDREADIYELFESAEENGNRVDLIVRAQHNRVLVDNERKLFDELKQSPVRCDVEVDIPPQRRRKNKKDKTERPYIPARTAALQVRYKKVRLKPPASPILKNRKAITLRAVYVVEENPPEGAEKINWFLLTTLKVKNNDAAKEVIDFYRRRWRIEEWHRVLKTGLGVEEYKNGSAERIKRILAIDMVIGWWAMLLTVLGREIPGVPADLMFDAKQCAIINALVGKKKTLSARPSMP